MQKANGAVNVKNMQFESLNVSDHENNTTQPQQSPLSESVQLKYK